MKVSRLVLLAIMVAGATAAWGQPTQKEPHIGYLYPAGGQRGTVVQVVVGGQRLVGATDAYVSGEGVRATVVETYRPLRNLDKEEREALQQRFRSLIEQRLAELPAGDHELQPLGQALLKKLKGPGKAAAADTQPVTLPAHPLLRDLENKNLRELRHVMHELLGLRQRQFNAQIGESVLVEVAIEANAAPGDRELRLKTPAGLTNPLCFQVGTLPETRELEPNGLENANALVEEPPCDVPVLLNGQIQPGDVDRFRLRAKRGQQLVIEARARQLIPYLADAVPGWFQATLALYDSQGHEMAFTDDYRFNPDPVLFFKVPETGEYELEIRDALYRGRDDFVYRVAVSDQPFITQMFPLGGRVGAKVVAFIDGWNLPTKRLPLDTESDRARIRETELRHKDLLSNRVVYSVDSLPECDETESNDAPQDAQRIEPPSIINGRIAQPGDIDMFQFPGRAGQEIVAEVHARRLNSPLDSLLRLTDASGRVLEWNDDHEDKESGLSTHHADSYLRTRLPEDGTYFVHLTDSGHHGGRAYAYRLRIGPPQPDFALRVTPSSINVRGGWPVPIRVYVMRKDGFDGDIEVALKDAPTGFVLSGGRVPAGRDAVRMTLATPREPLDRPVALRMEGRAKLDGQTVIRPAVPAEDMMQAFLYRHLVPSQELMVAVMGQRAGPPLVLADHGPVRIPAGGTAQVRVKSPRRPILREIRLELSEPPPGLTLQGVTAALGGLAFTLKADEHAAPVGLADNLIVEAFAEVSEDKPGGQESDKKRRIPLGVLPAIPFEIVPREPVTSLPP